MPWNFKNGCWRNYTIEFYIYLLQITYSTFANLLCKKLLHIFSMIILWLLILLFFFNIHVVVNFFYFQWRLDIYIYHEDDYDKVAIFIKLIFGGIYFYFILFCFYLFKIRPLFLDELFCCKDKYMYFYFYWLSFSAW